MTPIVCKMKMWGIKTYDAIPSAPVFCDISFMPVYNPDKTTENWKFWNATPSGRLELSVVNKDAVSELVPNEEYYVIITKEKPPSIAFD